MRDMFVCLCTVVLLVACDGPRRSPTAPGPVPVPPATHTLTGVVRGGGAPVSGATVVVRDVNGYFEDKYYATLPTELLATTDGNGYYSIPNVPEKISSPFGVMARASKPGYFTDFKQPVMVKDTSLDFELDLWAPIALEAVIRGRVGDAGCAGLGYGPGPCQRFALTVPAPATLELTAPVFNFELSVVTPDGKFAVMYSPTSSSSPLQIRIAVEAGTHEINVAGAGPTRDFVLTTALR